MKWELFSAHPVTKISDTISRTDLHQFIIRKRTTLSSFFVLIQFLPNAEAQTSPTDQNVIKSLQTWKKSNIAPRRPWLVSGEFSEMKTILFNQSEWQFSVLLITGQICHQKVDLKSISISSFGTMEKLPGDPPPFPTSCASARPGPCELDFSPGNRNFLRVTW